MVEDTHAAFHPGMDIAFDNERQLVSLETLDLERAVARDDIAAAGVLDRVPNPADVMGNRSAILGDQDLPFAHAQTMWEEGTARLIDLNLFVLDVFQRGVNG